jgi:hypothetical protein
VGFQLTFFGIPCRPLMNRMNHGHGRRTAPADTRSSRAALRWRDGGGALPRVGGGLAEGQGEATRLRAEEGRRGHRPASWRDAGGVPARPGWRSMSALGEGVAGVCDSARWRARADGLPAAPALRVGGSAQRGTLVVADGLPRPPIHSQRVVAPRRRSVSGRARTGSVPGSAAFLLGQAFGFFDQMRRKGQQADPWARHRVFLA